MNEVPVKEIQQVLLRHDLGCLAAEPRSLRGDGSARRFFRVSLIQEGTAIAVLPPAEAGLFSPEAASSAAINKHLAAKGVAVPLLLAYEPESGLLLYEDAGDTHLAEWVVRQQDEAQVEAMYRHVIDALLLMQIKGAEDFQADMCWDAPYYDRQTMLEREGLYFLESFCIGYLGLAIDKTALLGEISRIIDRIEAISGRAGEFFLHRDFQSRNIMVPADGSLRIIDYQAGRFGPLAYDIASLLIDPYVTLASSLQERLLTYYCRRLEKRFGLNADRVLDSYDYLACMRNMQILGAFSFLLRNRGKVFFEQFIPTALKTLRYRLHKDWASGYPALLDLTQRLIAHQDSLEQRFNL